LSAGNEVGASVLFFGCRHPQIDWLYRDLMEQSVKSGVLGTLSLAFSRENVRFHSFH
jgi:cytochrome P450/NADPH-cytochrome P450 reductase